MLAAEDIRGIVGILPTPAQPGADRWDAVDTVDLVEAVRMTEAIVAGGVDALLTNGTFGEGATLTWPEALRFNEVVLATVNGRVPVFCGATTLNTRDTIAHGRDLVAIGATGLFVGRPMWLALDDRQIVTFYRSIAEALPDTSIVVYDNPIAFKGKISSAAYAELAAIPQIVASKHRGVQAGVEQFSDDLRAVDGRIKLLPVGHNWLATARHFPEADACWSGDVACDPTPMRVLRDHLFAGRLDAAAAVDADIHWALETVYPGGDVEEFMRYSIQIDRAKFDGAGFVQAGPTRPPYDSAPESHLAGGIEAGRRWAEIAAKHSDAVAAPPST